MTVLTHDEEKEFTVFNAAAFDLARLDAIKRGESIPTWLCTSTEIRAQYRTALCVMLRKDERQCRTWSEARIERHINELEAMASVVDMWRDAEIEFKRRRDSGNVRSFFLDDVTDAVHA